MNITQHAHQRLQQRGLREADLDLILQHGTETDDGVYLRDVDVQRAEAQLKMLIARLRRLAGRYVVVKGENIITAYYPSNKKQKTLLRTD